MFLEGLLDASEMAMVLQLSKSKGGERPVLGVPSQEAFSLFKIM